MPGVWRFQSCSRCPPSSRRNLATNPSGQRCAAYRYCFALLVLTLQFEIEAGKISQHHTTFCCPISKYVAYIMAIPRVVRCCSRQGPKLPIEPAHASPMWPRRVPRLPAATLSSPTVCPYPSTYPFCSYCLMPGAALSVRTARKRLLCLKPRSFSSNCCSLIDRLILLAGHFWSKIVPFFAPKVFI
jgi:hypothetical protein